MLDAVGDVTGLGHDLGMVKTSDPTVEELVSRVQEAGGELQIENPRSSVRASWRRAIHAAVTDGGLPPGMRLRHTGRDAGDLVIRLVPDTEENKPIPDPPPTVPAPTRLPNRPHPVVVATREIARESGYCWIDTRRHPGVAHVAVSKSNLRRALLLIQGLFAEAERRGYSVEAFSRSHSTCRGGVGLRIRGEVHEVVLIEEQRREEPDPSIERRPYEYVPRSVLVPTGRLRLKLGHDSYSPPLATDRDRWRIEDRPGHAFERLEARAAEAEERRLQREAEEAEREARRLREREEAETKAAERERLDHLIGQVQAWRLAADIREFVDNARVAGLDATPASADWLAWAARMAAQVDPIESGTLGPNI